MVSAVQPVTLSTANRFVIAWHRHSKPDIGHLWSLGLFGPDLTLHGVAIIGRPKARGLQDGQTVEVTRVATDGTRDACSQLYGAACREARRRGYLRVVTYTLATETGASVRASGFHRAGHVKGRQWDTPSRRRAARDALTGSVGSARHEAAPSGAKHPQISRTTS